MGFENGFDPSEYVTNPSTERPNREAVPADRQESAELVRSRVDRLKNWLGNSADVLGQAGQNVALAAMYSGKELTLNHFWMTAVPHDSATAILLGLATGTKLGAAVSVALEAIQDELHDPQGRYIRELKRIKREFSEAGPELEHVRDQHIAEARQRFRREEHQEEQLLGNPPRWTNLSEITLTDVNERRLELARQSERGYLERQLGTRNVPDLPEESIPQPIASVPDLFPENEDKNAHE